MISFVVVVQPLRAKVAPNETRTSPVTPAAPVWMCENVGVALAVPRGVSLRLLYDQQTLSVFALRRTTTLPWSPTWAWAFAPVSFATSAFHRFRWNPAWSV